MYSPYRIVFISLHNKLLVQSSNKESSYWFRRCNSRWSGPKHFYVDRNARSMWQT